MSNNEENVSSKALNPKSNSLGICALIFSILGLFLLAIVFIPVAFVLSVIAIVKKQYVWGICALIISIIAVFMSPSLWFILAAIGLK